VRALATRLRVVYESALGEVELWNKSAASQLDAQLRERRRNFGRRLEAIERIQQAASGLDERIAEIDAQERVLNELDAKLTELTSHLMGGTSAQDKAQALLLQKMRGARGRLSVGGPQPPDAA
jgi:chromosome segregation ATPase